MLNSRGEGDEETIAEGIRYAAEQGAQVINLTFEFGSSTTSASQIPRIAAAVRYARRKGALIVAASGNTASSRVVYPAALPGVVSVGAVTEHGCLAEYSNTGPASTSSRPAAARTPRCPTSRTAARTARPAARSSSSRSRASNQHVPLPDGLLRHAHGHPARLGDRGADHRLRRARPETDARPRSSARLKATARDLGAPGPDETYGAGLIDAGAATAR